MTEQFHCNHAGHKHAVWRVRVQVSNSDATMSFTQVMMQLDMRGTKSNQLDVYYY